MWRNCLNVYLKAHEQIIELYRTDFVVIFRQESHINGITTASAYV